MRPETRAVPAGRFGVPRLAGCYTEVVNEARPPASTAGPLLHNGIGTGTVIADVLLTGLVGVLVDGMTGSWYGLEPETANVTLTRATTGDSGPEEIHIQLREADGKGRVVLKSDAPGVSVRVERKR